MLPSKEKFHHYCCPFYMSGDCDRPFCHFKHSDIPEKETDRSPSTSVFDYDEECPAFCTCHQQNVSTQVGKTSKSTISTSISTELFSKFTNELPQYRPTPIAELQKWSVYNLDYENGLKKTNIPCDSETYSPSTTLNFPSSLTYNPSNICTLNLNEQNSSKSKLEYNPSSGVKDKKLKLEYIPYDSFNIFQADAVNGLGLNKIENNSILINGVKTEIANQPSGKRVNSANLDNDFASTLSACDMSYIPTDKSKLLSSSSKVQDKSKNNKVDHNDESRKHKKIDHSKIDHNDENRKHKKSHTSRSSSSKQTLQDKSPSNKSSCRDESKQHRSHTVNSSSSQNRKRKHSSDEHANREDEKQHASKSEHRKSNSSSSKSSKHSHPNKKRSRHSSSKEKSKDRSHHKHHSSHRSSSSSKSNAKSHSSNAVNDKTALKDSSKAEKEESKDVENMMKDSDTSDYEVNPDLILQECYRIFEEFEFDDIISQSLSEKATNEEPSETDKDQIAEESYSAVIAAKKRVAHSAATANVACKSRTARIVRPISASAGQMLADRWRKQQELHLKEKQMKESTDQLLSLLGEKSANPTNVATKNKEFNATKPTIAQSLGKGQKRVAHRAKEEVLERPIVNALPGDKIPCSRRQHALNKLADACLKIYTTTAEAFEKAIELEKLCFDKSLTSTVYNNLFVNQILKLKHRENKTEESINITEARQVSHQKIMMSLNGSVVRETVFCRNYNFKGAELYRRLLKYKLSMDEMKEFNYPMLHETGEQGKASIYHLPKERVAKHDLDSFERTCSRCKTKYMINKHGMPKELSKSEMCIFHPKRGFYKTVRGVRDLYYDCCGRSGSSSLAGCESWKYHVTEEIDIRTLTGFVKTMPKGLPPHESKVFALDCEMAITTEGSALTRITVVDDNSEIVYDALVKPDKPVLDYVTRFSGIDENMLKKTNCTLRDVQGVLLNLFSEDTILIGHSLNSDLTVLKLIHHSVIDTSIVFPHKEGLPKRRALKTVANLFLQRVIQQNDNGHDSAEDAIACIDLMKYKVKEDAKLE